MVFVVGDGEVFRWRVSAVLLLQIGCVVFIPVFALVLLFCVLVLHLRLVALLLYLPRRVLLKSGPFVGLNRDVGTLRL